MEPEKFERIDFSITRGHEAYMKRALELARNGSGYVSPNPMVGCVIVHDGAIVGEGWHKKYGQAHAEVNAIASVQDKSVLRHSTLYVNLEPCSHQGKTPPCANLIIEHKVPNVVIANHDINPLVAGNGIKMLREAGINVTTEVLSKEAHALNNRFFTYMEKKRPHIILKWAETSDGFIARKNNDSRWISDAYSRQVVHKWRTEEDAVLVGSGTAWYDNPTLNVRDWSGRDPIRIVIDRYLKLGSNQNLFSRRQMTICYNLIKDEAHENLSYVRLPSENFLLSLIEHTYSLGIQSVIVEGGSKIINSFIEAGLWDEARIFISPQNFGEGVPAPRIRGVLQETHKLDNDWLKIYAPHPRPAQSRG